MRALRKFRARMKATTVAAGLSLITGLGYAFAGPPPADPATGTPIKHLVVIFQENVSFDHYFATYPVAENPPGEPFFSAQEGTPSVNGLSGSLLTNNPNNINPINPPNSFGNNNPFRLSRIQAATCDQGHDYKQEQQSFDFGLMDAFPKWVGARDCAGFDYTYGHDVGVVMGYFDGNTVTALWNYAQNFAMNDNSFGTVFGPSTPGALNLVSGQTGGVVAIGGSPLPGPDEVLGGVVIGDPQPLGDKCSTRDQARLSGPNIGDLLNDEGVSWGFFEGGFDLTKVNPDGTTGCNRDHPASTGGTKKDYIPHHEPFQYYASTRNLNHVRPSSIAMIGQTDAANHQYDIDDFFNAVNAGNMPAVSFLKAAGWQDGHAGYSDPLKEQTFLVNTINFVQKTKFWSTTAIVIAYDDSDGWYDHVMSPIVNSSATVQDALTGASKCGNGNPMAAIQGRCGYGPRLPLLVISPFARPNFVDHTLTDQSSILKFIEDNWGTGQIGGGSFDALAGQLTNMFDFSNTAFGARRLILDPNTGN